MKYIILPFLLLFITAHAGINKCTDANGKVSFSDKPCSTVSKSENITYKQRDWKKRLYSLTPKGIKILKIFKSQDETIVSYIFQNKKASNDFMQLVKKLSHLNISLKSFKQEKGRNNGTATLVASTEPNKLLKRFSGDK